MRKIIHMLIVYYLKKCWGAFHHVEYGANGRYVVLMNEQQYHEYQKISNIGALLWNEWL